MVLAHPGESLSVEADLSANTARDQKVCIDHVAVEFETGVIEDKVDSSILHFADDLPERVHVVSKNVGFGGSEVLSSGRLESLDIILGHVDQERKIGRVTPQADCSTYTGQQLLNGLNLLDTHLGSIRGRGASWQPRALQGQTRTLG